MPIEFESVQRHLEASGNAVLSQDVPRWEKYYDRFCDDFWREVLLPLVRASQQTFAVGDVALVPEIAVRSGFREVTSLVNEASGSFWWHWVKSGHAADGYLFFPCAVAEAQKSLLLDRSRAIGTFASIKRRFTRDGLAAIDACLARSPLAIGVPAPPFYSIYIIAKHHSNPK